MSASKRKVNFIKSWYNNECEKLSFNNKLKLARAWTDICIKDEEYEMASAIKEERSKMIANHIKKKRASRTRSQRLAIWFYLVMRRLRVYLVMRRLRVLKSKQKNK